MTRILSHYSRLTLSRAAHIQLRNYQTKRRMRRRRKREEKVDVYSLQNFPTTLHASVLLHSLWEYESKIVKLCIKPFDTPE